MNDQPAPPYRSLNALRQANDELLASLPEDKSDTEGWKSATARIFEFIRRPVATGALLDLPFERRAAQGLIDYWVASSYNMPIDGPKELLQSRKIATLLASFDAASLRAICDRGDQVISRLSSQDRDLARQLLVRLFRLSDSGRGLISVPTPREDLLSAGPHPRVNKIITDLVNAGVLRESHDGGGDFIDLAYEALDRNWEQLRLWINQRAKLRDAALAWQRTGKDESILLQANFVKEAMTYGNLNDLEKEFITASRWRERRFYLVLAGIAAVLVTILPVALYAYTKWYVPQMFARGLEIVRSDPSLEKRADALRRLAEYQRLVPGLPKDIDLRGIKLNGTDVPDGIDLRGLTAGSLVLTGATLQNVNFKNAILPSSSFIESTVIGSNFEGARLKFARFDDSFIESSTLSNADLFRAVFNGAQLCLVDFSEANVRYASFRDVKFEDREVPKFDNSAWWLATGWNKHQRELLTQQSANKDLKETKNFKQELKQRDDDLMQASNPVSRARALNERAWTLATFGVDLADAEGAVREALDIYNANRQSVPRPRDVPNAQDTLAYILMQKGDLMEAEKLLSDAVRDDDNDSILFRYALTLWMQGNVQPAQVYLMKSIARNYFPSHELYLLRGRIPDALEEVVEAASGNRQQRTPAKPCPSPPPS
jgi:uncharacterized protein YjbI with pentapeptide repeats